MSFLRLQMHEQFRQVLVAEHRFYIQQARQRLLSQFENIEAEANKASDAHFEKMSNHFNPEKHDPSRFTENAYQAAHDKGIEFYQLLTDMHEATRLSVVAGMFHQWDKSLRDWIFWEIRHENLGKNAGKKIWSIDFPQLMEFLAACGFDARMLACYDKLDSMRLVVNVFKHGNGPSFDTLKNSYPDFISQPQFVNDAASMFLQYSDYTDLHLTDADVEQFSEGIVDFWKAVPSENLCPAKINAPRWFLKALEKNGSAA